MSPSAPRLDVKICGLSTAETLDAALDAGASHVGFVHFPPSPRHLGLSPMAALGSQARGRAETVVVLVDPDDALLDAVASTVRPDWLQLHGRETPERVAEAATRTGLKVMKALAVAERTDLDRIAPYRGIADRILLDSRRPPGSALPGGNGVAFDWRLLEALDPALDIMLSGGLDAGNVGAALATARPGGIDVSSGVESAPGVKDPARILALFAALRSARPRQTFAKEGSAP